MTQGGSYLLVGMNVQSQSWREVQQVQWKLWRCSALMRKAQWSSDVPVCELCIHVDLSALYFTSLDLWICVM